MKNGMKFQTEKPRHVRKNAFSKGVKLPENSKLQGIPSPADLPNPGVEPGSPALQADSLPTEYEGLPLILSYFLNIPSFEIYHLLPEVKVLYNFFFHFLDC